MEAENEALRRKLQRLEDEIVKRLARTPRTRAFLADLLEIIRA
jgi:hypothetical protein